MSAATAASESNGVDSLCCFHSPRVTWATSLRPPAAVRRPTTAANEEAAPRDCCPKPAAAACARLTNLGLSVVAMVLSLALVAVGHRHAKGRLFPTQPDLGRAAIEAVLGPVLQPRPQRPRHRLEHPELAAARVRRLQPAAWSASRSGFIIGRFDFANRMISPLISLLRPVSPLAWLPIGLLVFKAPTRRDLDHLHLLDLAHGHQHRRRRAARVPADYLRTWPAC